MLARFLITIVLVAGLMVPAFGGVAEFGDNDPIPAKPSSTKSTPQNRVRQLSPNERWIVLASRESFTDAGELARRYSRLRPDVRILRAENGWYTVVFGPVPADVASSIKDDLMRRRDIPDDAYAATGRRFVTDVTNDPQPALVGSGSIVDSLVQRKSVLGAPQTTERTTNTAAASPDSDFSYLNWSKEQVTAAQNILRDNGFFKGESDGVFTQETSMALKSAISNFSDIIETAVVDRHRRSIIQNVLYGYHFAREQRLLQENDEKSTLEKPHGVLPTGRFMSSYREPGDYSHIEHITVMSFQPDSKCEWKETFINHSQDLVHEGSVFGTCFLVKAKSEKYDALVAKFDFKSGHPGLDPKQFDHLVALGRRDVPVFLTVFGAFGDNTIILWDRAFRRS
ncbi:hypothetical protein [Bradyrhizobium sp. 174]|uniref:hypothetical protein n=1 Tax=Bradyrhizobium sp. 174 TaxID=2782645 RepID=UPI001FF7E8BD|nr:hypothetical protein [Bradyrhizobium sp. 174]MCK1577837.1 hypothetical protein [Bradyrhizobium sp. 174]